MVAGNEGSSQGNDRSQGLLEAEKSRLTGRLSGFSDTVRETGRRFTGGDDNAISRLTNQAADSICQATDYLNTAEPRQLVRDVTDMARRRPEVFIGGALLVGLLLGRFLRSQPDGSVPEQVPPSGSEDQDFSNEFGDGGGAPTFDSSNSSDQSSDGSFRNNDDSGSKGAGEGASW